MLDSMIFKKGSIITYKDKDIYTISIVEKVADNMLYCNFSICSLDNGETFIRTSKLLKDYEGEELDNSLKLCNTEEFDIVICSDDIPRSALINV